uniref:Uncharacterized protein n=1 Tax=Lygus hesperus TaxID=30085 RepID=A0A0K8ST98_LYGHE
MFSRVLLRRLYSEPPSSVVGAVTYRTYSFSGITAGILMAVIVSYLTGPQNLETVDPAMIVPQMRWLLPSGAKTTLNGAKNARNGTKNTRKGTKNVSNDEDADDTYQELYALVPQEAPEADVTELESNRTVRS